MNDSFALSNLKISKVKLFSKHGKLEKITRKCFSPPFRTRIGEKQEFSAPLLSLAFNQINKLCLLNASYLQFSYVFPFTAIFPSKSWR